MYSLLKRNAALLDSSRSYAKRQSGRVVKTNAYIIVSITSNNLPISTYKILIVFATIAVFEMDWEATVERNTYQSVVVLRIQ